MQIRREVANRRRWAGPNMQSGGTSVYTFYLRFSISGVLFVSERVLVLVLAVPTPCGGPLVLIRAVASEWLLSVYATGFPVSLTRWVRSLLGPLRVNWVPGSC